MNSTRSSRKEGPKLWKGAILFGTALVVALGVGLFFQSGDDSGDAEASKPARVARVARPASEPAAVPAVAPWDEAIAANAGDQVADEPVATGPVSYEIAEAAYLARDWERAAGLFERYTEQRPENAWGHYMLGLSRREAGDLAGAEQAFGKTLEIAPDHGKARVNLARTLLSADRPDDALPWIDEAVAADPASVDALRVRGRVLHTLGRRDEALEAYAAALAVDPSDAWSLNNAGLILIESERFDEAAEHLSRACEAEPDVAIFQNNRGIAMERLEQYDEAKAAFAAALESDADHEKARVSLARVEAQVDAGTPGGPEPAVAEVELAAGLAAGPAEEEAGSEEPEGL